jgi:membrane protease YdiL (CAAX protease family)
MRFIVVALVLGALPQAGAIHAGLREGGQGWLLLTMWVPAVTAFTVSGVSRRMAWAAVRRAGWRWWAPGLALGLAPGLLKVGLLAATGTARWDATHFELAADGTSIHAIHKVGTVLGAGPQSYPFFALNLLLSISLGSVVSALVGGIGEELGWRGFLQPVLERRFGRVLGTILVGVVWAYWHLPVNSLGYNDPQHPLLNAWVTFPLTVVAMSFGFAWLARESGSAWPVALAHGANNTIGAAFLVTPKTWSADILTELASMAMVAAGFVWVALTRAREGRGAGGAPLVATEAVVLPPPSSDHQGAAAQP